MKKKYPGIQILRFIAASFVVIDHAILGIIRHWSGDTQLAQLAYLFGETGVFVFFGISGFIMVTTRYESFGSVEHSIDFILSRIIRILPIYAIATSMQYVNKMHAGSAYNFLNYIKSLLFIPYIGVEERYRPILEQGWTLNYEMFFYFIFAISLCLTRTKGLLLSIILFLILSGFHNFDMGGNLVLKFYANQILLYFICGMFVALAIKYLNTSVAQLFLPLLSVFLLMSVCIVLQIFIADNYHIFLSIAVAFVSVFICAICQPKHRGPFQAMLERLGDASYSTYLFHGFVLGAAKIFSSKIGEAHYAAMLAFVAFSILGANLAGLFSYKFVELPISGLLNTYYRKLKAGKYGRS